MATIDPSMYSPEYRQQLEMYLRKQKLAQALQEMGMRGPQMPQQVGAQAPKMGFMSALAPVIQSLMGSLQERQAGEGLQRVSGEADKATQAEIAKLLNRPGTPAVEGNNPSAFVPAQAAEPLQSTSRELAQALASQDPRVAAFAKLQQTQLAAREKEEREAQQKRLGWGIEALGKMDPVAATRSAQTGALPANIERPAAPAPIFDFKTGPDGKIFGTTTNIDPITGKQTGAMTGAGSSMSVNLPGQEGKALIDANVEELTKNRLPKAKDALSLLGNVSRIADELDAGAKTGGGESVKQAARKVFQAFGVEIPSTGPTEVVKNALAENIFAKAASLRPISNDEKNFLLQQVGSIDSDPQALANILSWYSGQALKSLQEFDAQKQILAQDSQFGKQYAALASGVDIPKRLSGPAWFQAQQLQALQKLGGDPTGFQLGNQTIEPDATFNIRGPRSGLQKPATVQQKPPGMSQADWNELLELRKQLGKTQ